MPDSIPATYSLGLRPSFGFGDRIGLATPGHIAAMTRAGGEILPIFAQQSIREMARTSRTPAAVMADAQSSVARAGWSDDTGSDADHLKTREDIERTAAAGFIMFTIDPSDHVDPKTGSYGEEELRSKFESIAQHAPWFSGYAGNRLTLATGTEVVLDEEACMRAAVKYGRAINEACALADHIAAVQTEARRDFEIELSVDETEEPTTLAEHYIIADQCLQHGMRLVSLAPRFIGDFEKGIDYRGDLTALEHSLADHAALAELLGPYKLSLHSGSDKLSMYPLLARATQGKFHVKTAGTCYLEAVRVIAHHDQELFRKIISRARQCYDKDRATYHVHATLDSAPPPEQVTDSHELEKHYLECWEDVANGKGFTAPGRQILHCTFGSVLTDPELGPALRSVLESEPAAHESILAEHFSRHLQALRAGM